MATERKMSAKGFLYKATTKAANSAIGFLAAHRRWLENGEAAEVASPILRMLDEGQLLPTPALELIKHAVMTHMIQAAANAAEQKILAQQEQEGQGPGAPRKDWMARVFDSKGHLCTRINAKGEVEDLEQTFDQASAADRWCDRRLFEGASDWYAVVEHTKIMRSDGSGPISTIILRGDAIARILKMPKGPTVHRKGQSTPRLGFGVKCKESRASFSRG